MEDWLEQMQQKKILQFDSEWNMQTSVCCVPLLKKRETQYHEINHRGDSDFLQLPGAARSTKMRAAKFPDTLTAVWKMDVTGCASRASETVRLRHKPQKRKKKKKPWRKSFARLHIFASAGGGSSRRRVCYVTCCVAKKTPGSLSADMWRSLIWVRAPCVFQQWRNTAYNILKLGAVYSFFQFCMYTLCTHSFHMYPTSTFSSVYVNMLRHFKISHVSHTKWDKVKYKDTFV